MVLLHGFGLTGDMWASLAIVLARNHTAIVSDLRGMGMSDHPGTGYTMKNQAVDIGGIMDDTFVREISEIGGAVQSWSTHRRHALKRDR